MSVNSLLNNLGRVQTWMSLIAMGILFVMIVLALIYGAFKAFKNRNVPKPSNYVKRPQDKNLGFGLAALLACILLMMYINYWSLKSTSGLAKLMRQSSGLSLLFGGVRLD